MLVSLLTVAVLVVTGGCVAVVDDDPEPDEIVDRLQTPSEEVETLEGTQVITYEANNSTRRIVANVTDRSPNDAGIEIIETAGTVELPGEIGVSTSNRTIVYDRTEEQATVYEHPSHEPLLLNTSRATLQELLVEGTAMYNGTDTVADRPVYVLQITDNDADTTATVYVDQERWIPLRYDILVGDDGQFRTTVSYQDVRVNLTTENDSLSSVRSANTTDTTENDTGA